MRLGRLSLPGPDGDVARLVAHLGDEPGDGEGAGEPVLDLARAERLRRVAAGAAEDAAARAAAALYPASTTAFLGLGPEQLDAARRLVDAVRGSDREGPLAGAVRRIGDGRLLSPVDPPLVRDFLSFEGHVRTAFGRLGRQAPPEVFALPVHYKANAATLLGPGDEVPWPAWCAELDYELEVGYVLGRPGRDLRPEEAARHVAGVVLYDDFSARDLLRTELAGGMGPAKGKDFATAMGPWLVTVDELGLGADLDGGLELRAEIDGEVWSAGSTAQAMWTPAELVAWASTAEPVRPGEVLGSGTLPAGCGFELGRYPAPGAQVVLHGAGLGSLRNRLGAPAAPAWFPTARRTGAADGERGP